jgi:hypothetical protein
MVRNARGVDVRIAERERRAQGILALHIALHELAIHYSHGRSILPIVGTKVSATAEWNPHRAEKPRRHEPDASPLWASRVEPFTLELHEHRPVQLPTERKGGRRSDARYTRYRPQPVEQVPRPRDGLIGSTHGLRIRPDIDDQAAGGLEPWTRRAQLRKALDQPSGAGHECQRERHLGNGHHAHHPHRAAPAARRPSAFVDQRLEICVRQTDGRRDAERNAANEQDDRRESEHT